MYRDAPGPLPALKHAVERLARVGARRRELEAIPDAKRGDRDLAELAELEAEQAALEGVGTHFDEAFADAAESALAGGGPHAAAVGTLLDAVPAMVKRKGSAQSVFTALRASRSMLGAVEVRTAGARRSPTQRSRGMHSRASVEARLGVSVTRLIFRLDAALEFSRPAGLDADVVEDIRILRNRLTRDADAGAEVLACGLVESREDLERLVTITAQAVDDLERRAHGLARRLFELVAYG